MWIIVVILLGLFVTWVRDFCSVGFTLACWGWDFRAFEELLTDFEFDFRGVPLSLSLLFSGLKILFFFNFFCGGSPDFEALLVDDFADVMTFAKKVIEMRIVF